MKKKLLKILNIICYTVTALLVVMLIIGFCLPPLETQAQEIGTIVGKKLPGSWNMHDYDGNKDSDIVYPSSLSAPYNASGKTHSNGNNLEDFMEVMVVGSSTSVTPLGWVDSSDAIVNAPYFDFLVTFKYPHRYRVMQIKVTSSQGEYAIGADADWVKSGKTVRFFEEYYRSNPKANNELNGYADGKYQLQIDYIVDDGACTSHVGVGYFSIRYKSESIYVNNHPSSPYLSGVSNGGVTDQDVRFDWSENGAPGSATLNGNAYSKGTPISADGDYTILFNDNIGKQSTYTFAIDKTLLSGRLIGVANGGHTNGNVSFTWSGGVSGDYATLNGSSYNKEQTIKNDGNYTLVQYDRTGKSKTYTFTIDKTAVALSDVWIIGGKNASGIYYINRDIRAETSDSNVVSVKYKKKENATYLQSEIGRFQIDYTKENEGEWELIFIDWCDNASITLKVVMQKISDFGNINRVYNSYTINSFYKVTLPQYVFGATGALPDIAKVYSFESYTAALAWCIAKEEDYRVKKQGAVWIYISATNESVAQSYSDRGELESVINKYAKRYISTRQIYKGSAIDFGIIMDSSGTPDPDFFARNSVTLPSFLNEYSSLSVYRINKNFIFKQLSSLQSGSRVTMKYLANDFGITQEKMFAISYYKELAESLLKGETQIMQGYYLITESDDCGNIQEFIGYIDTESPSLEAQATRGDGEQILTFNSERIEDYGGTFYYLNFKINYLADNTDELIGMKIVGGKLDNYYLKGDTLPTLNATDTGAGKYTIKIYDRSGCALEFSIFIAGKEVSWEYSSLKPTADSLRIYFNLNDRNNAIKSLSIFKVKGSGELIKFTVDDNGKKIDFMSLEYEFKSGGKYTAEVTDLFGRTIVFESIFYQKGLPYGALSVENKSVTNKEVTFQYVAGFELIVYVWESGAKKQWTNYLKEYSASAERFTITFVADVAHTQDYELYLYSTADNEMFIEYSFSIDVVLADFTITDLDGNPIPQDGATNKGFMIEWSEGGVSVKYSTGMINNGIYSRGTKLVANGKYTITVKDRVGNNITFTILVDTVVSYLIEGEYKNINGEYVTNKKIKIDVQENYTEFVVTSDNGYVFENNAPILFEGRYSVRIVDKYGNVVILTIITDFTAPSASVEGIESGATNGDVTFKFESGASAELYRGSTFIKTITQDEKFGSHGSYELRVTDIAGNITKIIFNVDKLVDFKIDVINGQITTNKVNISFDEEMRGVKVLLGGAEQTLEGLPKSFIVAGKYTLELTDKIGNTASISFEIKNKRAKTHTLELPLTAQIKNCKLGGLPFDMKNAELNESGTYEFEIFDNVAVKTYTLTLVVDSTAPACEIVAIKNTVNFKNFTKTGCKLQLFRNDVEIECNENMTIKEPGRYKLVMADDLGNISEYTFEIKFVLSGWALALIVLGITIAIALTLIGLRARKIKAS